MQSHPARPPGTLQVATFDAGPFRDSAAHGTTGIKPRQQHCCPPSSTSTRTTSYAVQIVADLLMACLHCHPASPGCACTRRAQRPGASVCWMGNACLALIPRLDYLLSFQCLGVFDRRIFQTRGRSGCHSSSGRQHRPWRCPQEMRCASCCQVVDDMRRGVSWGSTRQWTLSPSSWAAVKGSWGYERRREYCCGTLPKQKFYERIWALCWCVTGGALRSDAWWLSPFLL